MGWPAIRCLVNRNRMIRRLPAVLVALRSGPCFETLFVWRKQLIALLDRQFRSNRDKLFGNETRNV